MVSVVDCAGPLDVAEMLTLCTLLTAVEVTVKVALLRPAGTVTCD